MSIQYRLTFPNYNFMNLSEFADKYANILTVIGFIITILTFIGVLANKKQLKKLNKKNYAVNRMPDNLSDLKILSRDISILNSNFESNKKELLVEISKISPILKSLKKSLNINDLEHHNNLKNHVKKIKKAYFSSDEVSFIKKIFGNFTILDERFINDVYRLLTALITDIDNISKDNKQNLM